MCTFQGLYVYVSGVICVRLFYLYTNILYTIQYRFITVHKMNKSIIVKDNSLISASYSMNVIEQRIILLAIAKSRKTQVPLSPIQYINISVDEYISNFNITGNSVYENIKTGCRQLFNREFRYIKSDGTKVLSRWISSIQYHDKNGSLSLLFSPELIPFISELEKRFTSYFLKDISKLSSSYAIRLYELIIAWKSTHKTPIFEIPYFRESLGVACDEYLDIRNLKKRVLDVAINQINEHSNIRIEVNQHKKGRSISGFSFTFIELKEKEINKDPNTIDWIDESQSKSKREKLTINDIVCRHPNETIGKTEPEIYKIFGNKYHII